MSRRASSSIGARVSGCGGRLAFVLYPGRLSVPGWVLRSLLRDAAGTSAWLTVVPRLLLPLGCPLSFAEVARLLLFLFLLRSARSSLVRLVVRGGARVLVFREIELLYGQLTILELRPLRLHHLFSLHFLLNIVKEGLKLQHLLLVAVKVRACPAALALIRVVGVVAREEHILRLLVG